MAKKKDALQMQSLVSAPPFRMRRFVKWSEVDAAAIAYTPHLLNYSIEAAEQWFGYVVGKHLRKFQLQYDVDTPIAHCSMDFKLPLELNDSVDLVLLLTRIGNKSYSLAIDGLDGQNRVCFTAKLVYALTRLDHSAAVPLPAELVERLEAYREECKDAAESC